MEVFIPNTNGHHFIIVEANFVKYGLLYWKRREFWLWFLEEAVPKAYMEFPDNKE